MFPDILNVIVAGLIAGFIFSMPVAGPISILITSNALKGRLRFCKRTAIGASIGEFIYVFLALVGIKSLYSYYQPFIPYLLITGSLFLGFIAVKVFRTKLNLDSLNGNEKLTDKEANKGGLRTGLIINLTNPSLFIGWLASSFLIFSLMSSLNLSTGGLDIVVNQNVSSLSEITGGEIDKIEELQMQIEPGKNANNSSNEISIFLLASIYAASIGIGGFIWLYLFAIIVVKYRSKFDINIINRIIQFLGICLLGISVYLVIKAVQII